MNSRLIGLMRSGDFKNKELLLLIQSGALIGAEITFGIGAKPRTGRIKRTIVDTDFSVFIHVECVDGPRRAYLKKIRSIDGVDI